MLTIEEINVPSPRRVVLEGDDIPHGRPRKDPAWESGGETQRERIDLPSVTIVHVGATPLRSRTLKGAFRDHFAGTQGHARQMRDRLEELRRRANRVRVSWEGEEFEGLLVETKFGEEGRFDITYELTFEAFRVSPTLAIISEPSTNNNASVDAVANARRELETHRARLAALRTRGTRVNGVLQQIDQVRSTMAQVETEVSALDQRARAAFSQVRRVLSIASTAQSLAASAQRGLRALRAETDLATRTATDLVAFRRATMDTDAELLRSRDALRAVIAESRRRVRRTVRLYQVRPGDTLESIAQRALGSAARAGDLGVRVDDLRPGAVIRLPDAA